MLQAHEERDDSPVRVTAEAVERLGRGEHDEGRLLTHVEGAVSAEGAADPAELQVLPDDVFDADVLANAIHLRSGGFGEGLERRGGEVGVARDGHALQGTRRAPTRKEANRAGDGTPRRLFRERCLGTILSMPPQPPHTTPKDAPPPWNGHTLDEAAERALDAYLTVALRVYERLLNDPEAYAAYRRLTTPTYVRTMKETGSNPEHTANP